MIAAKTAMGNCYVFPECIFPHLVFPLLSTVPCFQVFFTRPNCDDDDMGGVLGGVGVGPGGVGGVVGPGGARQGNKMFSSDPFR